MGIRRNGDDDDNDGLPDNTHRNVTTGDDDLLKLQMFTRSLPFGLEVRMERDGTLVELWKDSFKSVPFLVGSDMVAWAGSTANVYAEWIAETSVPVTFTASLWDTINNQRLYEDVITFQPFRSVVAVFGGRHQTPTDQANSMSGIYDLGRMLQGEGYDVHMYGYYDVSSWDGSGKAFDQIANAVSFRGVEQAALMGYSWGGGAVYDLSYRLDAQNIAASLKLTGYIDAVRLYEEIGENRRPVASEFHVNQYTETWYNIGGEPADHGRDDDAFNRSNIGVDHESIDDSLTVKNWLVTRATQKVLR